MKILNIYIYIYIGGMKDWKKNTMVETNEKLNKIRIAKKKQKNKKKRKMLKM